MSVSRVEENTRYIILNIFGFIFMASPILFPNTEVLAGICTVLGFTLLMAGGRSADNTRQAVYNILLLWVAQAIRFSMIFGSSMTYVIVVIVVMFIYSMAIGIGVLIDNLFMRKYIPVVAVLIMPVTYTVIQFILTVVNLGYVLNITSYVMCISPISHGIKILGEYGMTFVVMLILSVFAQMLNSYDLRSFIVSFVIFAFVATALYLGGAYQFSMVKGEPYTIDVAIGTAEQMDMDGNSYQNYTLEDRIEIFKREVKEAASMNADILVLNEEFMELSRNDEAETMETVCSVVKKYKIPVLFCVDLIQKGDEPGENKAMYIDRNGEIVFTYYKNNLVPFLESNYISNSKGIAEYADVNIGGHNIKIACVICFDLNDELYMSKIDDDTELIIAPSWDWDNANIEQKRTFVRSIELNTTLLKHTYEGFTYTSGPKGIYGEIVDTRNVYETVSMIKVPIWEKSDN